MGVPGDLADKFLDSEAFTPRHDTIIVASLATLKNAQGIDAFIHYALVANDEETANFFQDMAETMRGYNERVSPIVDIKIISGLVFAKAKDGSVLIPLPLDHGVWTERADRVASSAIKFYTDSEPSSSGKFVSWVTGTVTSMAREQLAQRGIKVEEDIAEKIHFTY